MLTLGWQDHSKDDPLKIESIQYKYTHTHTPPPTASRFSTSTVYSPKLYYVRHLKILLQYILGNLIWRGNLHWKKNKGLRKWQLCLGFLHSHVVSYGAIGSFPILQFQLSHLQIGYNNTCLIGVLLIMNNSMYEMTRTVYKFMLTVNKRSYYYYLYILCDLQSYNQHFKISWGHICCWLKEATLRHCLRNFKIKKYILFSQS